MTHHRLPIFLCALGLLALSACRQQRTTFRVIQAAAEPYQVYLKGPGPDQPARLSAATGINLRFIAAAGDVDFTVEVYAPLSPDGTPAKIWERRFHHATGHQAWEIVISADQSKELIQVVPSTWQAARASLVHLPEDVAGPDHLTEPDVQASPQFELHRPQ